MNIGQIVIDAVVKAGAIESAEHPTPESTVFVWSANAAEQIEAALAESGYTIVPNTEMTERRGQ